MSGLPVPNPRSTIDCFLNDTLFGFYYPRTRNEWLVQRSVNLPNADYVRMGDRFSNYLEKIVLEFCL